MGVYVAYALLVLHVLFGVLQGQTEPGIGWSLAGGARRCSRCIRHRALRKRASMPCPPSARPRGAPRTASSTSATRRIFPTRRARSSASAASGSPSFATTAGSRRSLGLSAPERSARRGQGRQRLRRLPVARLRVPAGHRRLAAAVHREGADLSCSRRRRRRARRSAAAAARHARRAGPRVIAMSQHDPPRTARRRRAFFIGYDPPLPVRSRAACDASWSARGVGLGGVGARRRPPRRRRRHVRVRHHHARHAAPSSAARTRRFADAGRPTGDAARGAGKHGAARWCAVSTDRAVTVDGPRISRDGEMLEIAECRRFASG